MTPPIAMLNPETAAPILDCSPDTVAELINAGELPGLRYGRSWIIPPAALDLRTGCNAQGKPPTEGRSA